MTYQNFKTLYYALERVRQIQGYGVFYNVKELNPEACMEQDYETLETYLLYGEQPVSAYEPMRRIAGDNNYVILKPKDRRRV